MLQKVMGRSIRNMTFEEYMEGIDRSVMEYLPDFIPSEAVRIVLDEQGDRPIFGLKIMLPQMEENDLNQLEIIIDLQGCYKEVKDLSLEHAVKETAVLITEILKLQKLSRIKAMVRTALDFEIAKEHLYMDLCNVGKRPDWLEECVCKKIPGAEDRCVEETCYYPNEVPESLSVGDVVRYNLVVAGKPKILEITEEGNFENPEIMRFEQWRDCFYINGHRLWIGPNTYFIVVSVDLFGIYNKSTDRYYVTNVYEDEFIPVPNE